MGSLAKTKFDFVTVDVFTSQAYEGNPLAIVRIPHCQTLSQEQKQTIAREFNLSETTFLHENGDSDLRTWRVDIYITTAELAFAGHPTIGTACYVLDRIAKEQGIQDGSIEAQFNLKAGPTGLKFDVAKRTTTASIPHDVHIHKKSWSREALFELQPRLGEGYAQKKIQVPDTSAVVSIVKGMTFALVELDSLEALALVSLASQRLRIEGLEKEWDTGFQGSYFFVQTGKRADGTQTVRTRMIEGPLEDPATGSAASALTSFLTLTEGQAGEAHKFEVIQGVEMGRRSEIFIEVHLAKNKTVSEVLLEGMAVEIMEGKLTI